MPPVYLLSKQLILLTNAGYFGDYNRIFGGNPERPLWMESGHSEARKLPDGRFGARDASTNVRFRPGADLHEGPLSAMGLVVS